MIFFYTLNYEHVGKIQKTEKKTKHRYIVDEKEGNKQTPVPSFLFT